MLRTKVRTFLTVLAFVIGTFTLGMVTAFSQGLRSYINTQLHAFGQPNVITVGVGASAAKSSSSGVPYYDPNRQASTTGGPRDSGITYTLSQHDITIIEAVPHIAAAYPDYSNLYVGYIQLGSSQKFVIQVQSAVPGESINLASGQFPDQNQKTGIVLPYAYVEALGIQSPDQLTGKTVQLQVPSTTTSGAKLYNATVTGVLPDTAHQPAAYVSYQLLNEMVTYQTGGNGVFSNIIAVTTPDATKADRNQIKSTLQSKDYKVETYDDLLQQFSRPLNIVQFGLSGFAAIALLAATIGIINTLLMAVLERTQEIGLLKALGVRRRGITFIYLVEAASLGFWGGVVGVLAAMLLGLIANPILNRTIFKGIGTAHILTYPLPYMLAIIGGAMVIGLLAGTLPAIRAGKLDPIEALRRE